MKLWQKETDVNKRIEKFTVGRDRELDLLLAQYDVLGSIAHCIMLEKVGLLSNQELKEIRAELKMIYKEIEAGKFVIEEGIEDVHSQVEFMLTKKIGNTGKKIHSARSRNDQVLLDLKLFSRAGILAVAESMENLFQTLIRLSDTHKDRLMPGYTHLQVAMPSSFGLWFGAYAESLSDDLLVLQSAFRIANQNPLGSAAGYGSSFPIDRQMTTDLLGFERMNYNVVYAQMGRGKMERIVASALASVAATLSRLAYDACLFMNQNFGFIGLPEELTTGSSIMPHKKNPDVFELLRAKCNKLQSLPQEITLLTNNLPSGYFRDMQIIKEGFLGSFDTLMDCLAIAQFAMENIRVKDGLLDDEKYQYIFSVEEVNREVLKGIPFREAYQLVGQRINQGEFNPEKSLHHTHEGSLGNLCNDRIMEKFNEIMNGFQKEKIIEAEKKLLS
ncbi:MAG: argininosuccinate lyase [Bacteroidales bacterium]|nr:argininosuccinate lyase [Bacteroidales bacterium]